MFDDEPTKIPTGNELPEHDVCDTCGGEHEQAECPELGGEG